MSNASVEAGGNYSLFVSASCIKYAEKPNLHSTVELLPWKAYFFFVADHTGHLDGTLVSIHLQRLKCQLQINLLAELCFLSICC
jgi:hypothetical protein